MKKTVFIGLLFLVFAISCIPAYACGGAATGGATEWTQQLNNALLESIKGTGLDEVYNTTQMVAKQAQQYATQLQELQQAILANVSMPFQIANDFKNTFSQLYGTLKGSGEAMYSYANAENWISGVTSRSGIMNNLQYSQDSNKAAMKVAQDIITKDESEAALAKDIENSSNNAQGATAAVQANTQAAMANNAAIRNQTALQASFYEAQYNRWAIEDAKKQAQWKLEETLIEENLAARKAHKY